MIKVCDAIMGTGKSSAAINYINEHSEQKFIYITPYLSEATRIRDACPQMHFIEPSNKLKEYSFKKSIHTSALIREGMNITTTHQAFRGYTNETLAEIRRQQYTLIIDENVEVLEKFDVNVGDLQLAVDAGYIKEDNGIYTLGDVSYRGRALSELFTLLKSRELVRVQEGDGDMFFWALPPELITSFKDVFVLTYLFGGQSLHHFFQIYDIPYEFIGIDKYPDGSFHFGSPPGYIPEYTTHIRDKLHILDNSRLNDIGDGYHALSMTWFKRHGADAEQLKRNISNCFNNIWRDVPAERRLWGSHKEAFNQLRGKGYSKSFLTFNTKATNAYRECDRLVYITNLFMNVGEKMFYQMHGVEIDEDLFALSIMVQWIWRSAIRDGNEVYVYIPSRRMRTILNGWIDELSNGGKNV